MEHTLKRFLNTEGLRKLQNSFDEGIDWFSELENILTRLIFSSLTSWSSKTLIAIMAAAPVATDASIKMTR